MRGKIVTQETKDRIYALYQEKLALQKIADQTEVSYSYVWGIIRSREMGFISRREYQESLLKKRGYSSKKEYDKELITLNGFESERDYRDKLARKKGYLSKLDYRKNLKKRKVSEVKVPSVEKVSEIKVKKEISLLINRRLNEIDKSQKWLAQETGISCSSINSYINSRNMPNSDTLRNIFTSLGITEIPQSLEHLVNKDASSLFN